MSNGTKSTSGTPTVKEKKDYFDKEQERLAVNFKKAVDGFKQMRNPNKTSGVVINQTSREEIRDLLQNLGSSEVKLKDAAKYLYYRSNIFFRVINFYAQQWCLECRKVIPKMSLVKDGDPNKILKQFNNTLDALDRFNLNNNINPVLVNCYLSDVCYSIFYHDDTGSFFYILAPDECKISGQYYTGDYEFYVDMSKWRSSAKQEVINYLGEPLKSMYDEYKKTNEKYIRMPDEYAACFKFRNDNISTIIPPFSALLQQLAGLNDLADIQAIADEASIYKLLLVPMKVLQGAKQSDDFEISPDLLLQYYDRLLESLPDYVAAAPIPGEVTNNNVVDFSTTSSDKDIDRLEQSQNQLLSTAGGGGVIGSNNIKNTAAFNAWLKYESNFAIGSLMPQIEGFTNRMLRLNVSNPCKVEYFRVTIYTKDDMRKSLLESCQYGFSNRLAYNTFNGISEKATIAMQFLENQVLMLQEKMIYPLQSSYTQSSSTTGRPKTPDDEIEDSTERSRNNPS